MRGKSGADLKRNFSTGGVILKALVAGLEEREVSLLAVLPGSEVGVFTLAFVLVELDADKVGVDEVVEELEGVDTAEDVIVVVAVVAEAEVDRD
jgi:hypothetical protein